MFLRSLLYLADFFLFETSSASFKTSECQWVGSSCIEIASRIDSLYIYIIWFLKIGPYNNSIHSYYCSWIIFPCKYITAFLCAHWRWHHRGKTPDRMSVLSQWNCIRYRIILLYHKGCLWKAIKHWDFSKLFFRT